MNIFSKLFGGGSDFPIPKLSLPNADYRASVVESRLEMIKKFGIRETQDILDAEYMCPNCRKESKSLVAIAPEYGNDESAMIETLKNNPSKFLNNNPNCNCQDHNSPKLVLRQVIYCRTNPSSSEDFHQYIRYDTQLSSAGDALIIVNLNKKTVEYIPRNELTGTKYTSRSQVVSKGFDMNPNSFNRQNEEHTLFLTSDYKKIIWINHNKNKQSTHLFVQLKEKTENSLTFIDEEFNQWILSNQSITMTNLNNGDTISFRLESR